MKYDQANQRITMKPTKPGQYSLLVKLEDEQGSKIIKSLKISFNEKVELEKISDAKDAEVATPTTAVTKAPPPKK